MQDREARILARTVARVVRLSPLPLRPDRQAELERLFAGPVEVAWAPDLHSLARELAQPAHAVVLDAVSPLDLPAAVALCGAVPVLRPLRADSKTSRGERVARFAGYSTGDGPLADGALVNTGAALPPVA